METTPDTVNYMLAGYGVLLGLPFLYVLSWGWRRRSLLKDLQLLRSLTDDK